MLNSAQFIAVSGLLLVALASGLVGYGVRHWRKGRLGGDDQAVSQLTGALKSKEVQAEILIESITDGIIVVDTKNTITLINKAAGRMAGWPINEAMGLDARVVLQLIKDEVSGEVVADSEHPFTLILQKRTPFRRTLQLRSRDNKKLFISLVISPVILPKNNELMGAVAVFRDVSEQRKEEQKHAEFISTASHEMRTPIAAIEGYLALALNDHVSHIDEKAREYLQKAHSSTKLLGNLFQDLLTSAKAEDGRLANHPVVVELGTLVEQLVEDMRFGAQKKSLEVEFLINSGGKDTDFIDASGSSNLKVIQPLYYVKADPDRLREVITNLFDNAIKYTDQGKVSVGITGNEEVVQIRVTDTGSGIPPEDLPHLFQKFYRVDNSATRSIGGTGLGLFICRKIIELYSGSIWAESAVGKGSTFYINLPRLSTAQAAQSQLSENPPLISPTPSKVL